jgi:hypothetical protein
LAKKELTFPSKSVITEHKKIDVSIMGKNEQNLQQAF